MLTQLLMPLLPLGAVTAVVLPLVASEVPREPIKVVLAVPACSVPVEDGTIKTIIEDSPYSKIINAKVFNVTDPKETTGLVGDKRHCTALVWANFGKVWMKYSIEPTGDNFWVQGEGMDNPNLTN